MLKAKEIRALKKYLKELKNVSVTKPYARNLSVYNVNKCAFAYLEAGKHFMRLSLRSDPHLADVLKERYDEVSPGQKLDPKKWVTIVISGQLSYSELTALIDHSYQLALSEV